MWEWGEGRAEMGLIEVNVGYIPDHPTKPSASDSVGVEGGGDLLSPLSVTSRASLPALWSLVRRFSPLFLPTAACSRSPVSHHHPQTSEQ